MENVKLEIFEGPLDLLLHLIRKNEVDIYDIPIALITGQYLEYLEFMKEINIALAGEFMVMAATLIQIKSKMMLPLPEAEGEEESDDPRLFLLARLKEHARMKNAVDYLETRPRLGRDLFAREGAALDPGKGDGGEEIVRVGIFELVSALRGLMLKERRQLALKLEPLRRMSLEEKMSRLLSRLRHCLSLTFEQCFEEAYSRDDLVVTFLCLLELSKQGMVTLYQERSGEEDGSGRWGVIRARLAPRENWEAAGGAPARPGDESVLLISDGFNEN
ncbi:MAG: segregation/condensation protein A [Desulfarculales bacterium]|jgi:segregation and condensation protein A|nr:segregation/condensation protein A [Desulfarculales bacterium]